MIEVYQAKAHLRVTDTVDDVLIGEQLAAAKAFVSAYTGADVDLDGTPAPVRQAVLMLTAHLYENRETTLIGIQAQALPFGFLDLLSNYRAWAW